MSIPVNFKCWFIAWQKFLYFLIILSFCWFSTSWRVFMGVMCDKQLRDFFFQISDYGFGLTIVQTINHTITVFQQVSLTWAAECFFGSNTLAACWTEGRSWHSQRGEEVAVAVARLPFPRRLLPLSHALSLFILDQGQRKRGNMTAIHISDFWLIFDLLCVSFS